MARGLIGLTLALATLAGWPVEAQPAAERSRYILALGRRLPYVYAVSFEAAGFEIGDVPAEPEYVSADVRWRLFECDEYTVFVTHRAFEQELQCKDRFRAAGGSRDER